MSPKERRAYRLGFLHAMRRARKDLHAVAQHWDDEIARLTDILQDTVNEFHRLKAVEHAIDTERDIDTRLN
jgi:hypothetical protein